MINNSSDVVGVEPLAVSRSPTAAPSESLPPEFDLGNVEYKLILPSTLTRCRFEHLVTQMKWRLMEGLGEAVYEIGVADDGQLKGLASEDLNASLETLRDMANQVGASMTIIRRRTVATYAIVENIPADAAACHGDVPAREICEVLVRRIPAEDQGFIDIRVSLLGDADAGKSTLLEPAGVLSSGERDNGKGRARLNLFRHPHEILTGRTSSVSNEIIGFDERGRLVNYAKTRTAEEICRKSTKLLTLTDLCGHERYLRTTVSGLVGHKPDFIMIVINSVQFNDNYASSHQLALARAVGAPIFIVMTKIDLLTPTSTITSSSSAAKCADDAVQQSSRIRRLIESAVGGRRVPLIVESEDDAVSAAVNIQSESIVPVFRVSCKTGENMDLLVKFLNMLPPGRTLREKERLLQTPTVFAVTQWYRLPLPVGIVLAGFVEAGIIRPGDELLLGPDRDGQFTPVRVTSVHRYKRLCRMAKAGEAASVAIDGLSLDCALRKGLFLVHHDVLKSEEDLKTAGIDCHEKMSLTTVPLPSIMPLSPPAVIGKCCQSFRAEVQLYRPSSCRLSSNGHDADAIVTPTCTNRVNGLPTIKKAVYSQNRSVHVNTHLSLHIGNVVQTAVVTKVVDTLKRISSEVPMPSGGMSSINGDAVGVEHSAVMLRHPKHQRASAQSHAARARVDRLRKTQSWVDCFPDEFHANSIAACEPSTFPNQQNHSRPRSFAFETVSATDAVDTERRSCVFTAEFANDSASSSHEALATANGDGERDGSSSKHTQAEQLLIVFDFLQRPEFVLLNSKLILRQNRETIGVGKVVEFVEVVEPVQITNVWPSIAANKLSIVAAGGDVCAASVKASVLERSSSFGNLPRKKATNVDAARSATPPTRKLTANHDEDELIPSRVAPGYLLVHSNAASGTIEQQIRATQQSGLSSSNAAAMFNNDLVGFDSHSPLTQLDYLDDDD